MMFDKSIPIRELHNLLIKKKVCINMLNCMFSYRVFCRFDDQKGLLWIPHWCCTWVLERSMNTIPVKTAVKCIGQIRCHKVETVWIRYTFPAFFHNISLKLFKKEVLHYYVTEDRVSSSFAVVNQVESTNIIFLQVIVLIFW